LALIAISPLLLFDAVVALTVGQLTALALYSRHNVARRLNQGAVNVDSSGVGRANIALRCGWIAAMLAEVHGLDRTFDARIGVVAAALALIALSLRIQSMVQLGWRWTLPTIVKPGEAPETGGIYAWFRHPNWLGVMIEIPAIPMIHGAWITALVFGALEALLLSERRELEEAALVGAQASVPDLHAPEGKPHVGIIGAGAAGLAAAKALLDAKIAVTVFEQRLDVGGLWHADSASGIARNTHLVSPKSAQAFSDQPMPDSFPTYPRHHLVLSYLQNYAESRGLRDHVFFGRALEKARHDEGGWQLDFADGTKERFSHLIIASGYHNTPQMPDFTGQFSGQILHSKDYAGPETIAGKRVLVMGAGQSAMDVLCDAAAVAKSVFHSTRRGFICTPRYFMGQPTEAMIESPPPLIGPLLARLPLRWMFRMIALMSETVLRVAGTTNAKLGIPRYRIDESPPPPTMDQRVYNFYAIGDIAYRGPVAAFEGGQVVFADGRRDVIDIIVCGTGYRADFPFLDPTHQPTDPDGQNVLLKQIFHRNEPTLFFVGLIHPIGAHWRVFEWQAQLIATYLATNRARRSAFDLLSKGCYRRSSVPTGNGVLMVNKLAYARALKAERRRLVYD
jgi:isoprenylcysteine carboxyl methyltransferase (ICMT) family protein YpbQ